MIKTEVIIIGAGAAGLMCALTAAQQGRQVLVLDHAKKAGEKIRISGGGRCNFTNRYVSAENYLCANPHFCKSALAQFSSDDFIAMVEAHDIAYHEREHHQLFCDDSAQDILKMLLEGCRQLDVQFQLNCEVQSINKTNGYAIQSSHGLFQAESLVIATGGLSIPKMGASPFGLQIAHQFGLNIKETRAGLVPFTLTGKEKELFQALSGMSLPVSVSCRGQSFSEAMLFTHRGLSGPAMLQISSYWQVGDSICIDLLPQQDIEAHLLAQKEQNPKMQLQSALSLLLPKRLCQVLMQSVLSNTTLKQINAQQCAVINQQLHHWMLKPSGTEGYRTAEVTLGGVDTDAVSSKTMQCKKHDGLFFIGEVLDVTGHLGGFNFQWAWSSAYCAGLHA
ncbi:MAG: NAD(P)/FAD-dependent oxidoreductase [Mariprofundaceae bacterium]|nr:NAD(P)/FAD-dependent oxidoreductase [Mariprofundaceae bacterium]